MIRNDTGVGVNNVPPGHYSPVNSAPPPVNNVSPSEERAIRRKHRTGGNISIDIIVMIFLKTVTSSVRNHGAELQ